jgi:hypothetical protein
VNYHTVGEAIEFDITFYDVDGNVTTVPSATLTVVYPTSVASGALLWRDPGQQKAVSSIAMTQNLDGSYTANWDSSVSEAGTVFYSISGNGIVDEGAFILRGNIATLQSFPPQPASLP